MRHLILFAVALAACAPRAAPHPIVIENHVPSREPVVFTVEDDAWQLDIEDARLSAYDNGVELRAVRAARVPWTIFVRPATMGETTAAEVLARDRDLSTIPIEVVTMQEHGTFAWTLVTSERGRVSIARAIPGRDGDAVICWTAYPPGVDWHAALAACGQVRAR